VHGKFFAFVRNNNRTSVAVAVETPKRVIETAGPALRNGYLVMMDDPTVVLQGGAKGY